MESAIRTCVRGGRVRPEDEAIETRRATRWGRAIAACALAWLLIASTHARAESPRDTERFERAGALLENESGWADAIAIYRELVAVDPTWTEPRLQLARVLAWRGDYAESLALYEQLDAETPRPPEIAIERAEVLSWAGRSAEATSAFEALLEAHPDDARAARGAARNYRWAGERGRSDRWYTHALALADDREAREEQLALRSELKSEVVGRARAFFDSDDFSYYGTDSRVARDLDFDTRFFASSATFFLSHDREEGAPLYGDPDELRGFEGRLGVERRIDARWKGMLEAGGRYWEHADAVPLARGVVEYEPRENVSFAFEAAHDDMLERSYSLESVLKNVRRTSGKLSAWSQLAPSLEGYAETGGAFMSDSNAELFAGGSLSWKPVERYDVRLALAIDASGYSEYTEYYYAPELDLGSTFSVIGKLPIHGGLAFTFDVGGGGGLSREQGATETGPAYRTKAGFAYRRGGFAVDLDFARSQSVRAIAYTTHEAVLRASWSF